MEVQNGSYLHARSVQHMYRDQMLLSLKAYEEAWPSMEGYISGYILCILLQSLITQSGRAFQDKRLEPCVDTFPDCATIISLTNVCSDISSATNVGCALSCGFCPTAAPCVDTYPNCDTVARFTDLCQNRTEAAALGCLHTCNMCGIPCETNPLACNHGKCVASGTTYACVCDPGYTGADCLTDTDDCDQNPCVNGVCSDGINSFTCSCAAGYTGKLCDSHVDSCSSNPCVNGVCVTAASGFNCVCNAGYVGVLCDQAVHTPDPMDCKDILDNDVSALSGPYLVKSGRVYCDMKIAGGGWTVLLNRTSDAVDFKARTSTEYALGFGDIHTGYWLGLASMHNITSNGKHYILRVDMVDAQGSNFYEEYRDFTVGSAPLFRLGMTHYRGTAGDSLSGHNGMAFTTLDRDEDTNAGQNCASYVGGGWWFHNCYDSCLTCAYRKPGTLDCGAMSWNSLGYCKALAAASMMVRPS